MKSMTITVFGSPTIHQQMHDSKKLTTGGTVLNESDDIDILGVTFDSKMSFVKHLCSVFRADSQRLVILMNS